MNTLSPTDLLTIFVAFLALVVSLWSSVMQLRAERKARNIPIFVDVFKEYRDVEFKNHTYYILNQLTHECKPELGFKGLPENAKTHVITVSHFFDNLGYLVVNGIVDSKLILGFMGKNICDIYGVLKPYIDKERVNNQPYQKYFENLAALNQKTPTEDIVKKYKLTDFSTDKKC